MKWSLLFIWFLLHPSLETFPGMLIYQADSNTGFAKVTDRNSSSCFTDARQSMPWLSVDLRRIYLIYQITFVGRSDCCAEELDGAEVRVGFSDGINNPKFGTISVTVQENSFSLDLRGTEGRFINIVLPPNEKTLTICEISTYGEPLENVAVTGIASQSSTLDRSRNFAQKMIRGYPDGGCSLTQSGPGQWMTVDLLRPYNITFIHLTTEDSSCCPLQVKVDNSSCSYTGSYRDLHTLDCRGVEGSLITILHPDVPQALCEVQVFSTWVNPTGIPALPPTKDVCGEASCSRDFILIYESLTWHDAQTYCRRQYSDLASPVNVPEMNRIITRVGGVGNVWIGLYETQVTWKWSNSDSSHYEEHEAAFRSWASSEPKENTAVLQCAVTQQSGDWKSEDCNSRHSFLCFDGRGTQHQNQPPSSHVLVQKPMTWAEAQQYCRSQHTDLLSIQNLPENEDVGKSVPVGEVAWIGLFRSSWSWSDGSDSTFRYWAEEEQQDEPINGQKCGYISNARWRWRSCDTPTKFLCYYYKKKTLLSLDIDATSSDSVMKQQILVKLEQAMHEKGFTQFRIHWWPDS